MMERVNSSAIYLTYCKNFCKCHTVPPPSTAIKKKNKYKREIITKTKALKKKSQPNNDSKANLGSAVKDHMAQKV
jgi:hypothetical protein